MTPGDRKRAPLQADEVSTLRGFLDHHRDTLRWKAAGLDRAQLATPLPPSTMTLGGLLKHLAFVEQNWTVQVLHGRPAVPPFDSAPWADDRDWEWSSAAADPPEDLRALFDRTVAASDRAIDEALAVGGLDFVAAHADRHGGGAISLRWILVHLVEEYARHNGHADLLREAIDGATGE